uniref:Nematode cuticle collagen N-terminal domain-containing protein n=1 Tax=Plectus sambesii TaxID=2011161 RepID=A0A914VXX6_9BILA
MSLYTVRLATGVATCLSVGAIVLCMVMVPMILNDVSSAWQDFDFEMRTFRVQSNDLWKQMMSMSTPNTRFNARHTRQAGGEKCNCNADNKCPPGPAGPAGPKGENGNDGIPGAAGIPGADAEDAQSTHQEFEKCFHCPHGPMGPPGAPGRAGPRGMKGARGAPAMPGRDGPPGTPGEMGPPGPPGRDGDRGEQGEKGEDAESQKGVKGKRGPSGPAGPAGPKGAPGKDGGVGAAGPAGEPGQAGFQGPAGQEGGPGEPGEAGEPGKDANYCPCPSRGHPPGEVEGKQEETSKPGYRGRSRTWSHRGWCQMSCSRNKVLVRCEKFVPPGQGEMRPHLHDVDIRDAPFSLNSPDFLRNACHGREGGTIAAAVVIEWSGVASI